MLPVATMAPFFVPKKFSESLSVRNCTLAKYHHRSTQPASVPLSLARLLPQKAKLPELVLHLAQCISRQERDGMLATLGSGIVVLAFRRAANGVALQRCSGIARLHPTCGLGSFLLPSAAYQRLMACTSQAEATS